MPGSWNALASLDSHRITEWVRLQGTTGGHLVQAPRSAGLSQTTWHWVVSRQFFSVSSEGDSVPSLDNLFQCHSHGEVLSLLLVELPAHHSNTLPVASRPVAWCHREEPGSIFWYPAFTHLYTLVSSRSGTP